MYVCRLTVCPNAAKAWIEDDTEILEGFVSGGVHCQGNESSLLDCPRSQNRYWGEDKTNCISRAWVNCEGKSPGGKYNKDKTDMRNDTYI